MSTENTVNTTVTSKTLGEVCKDLQDTLKQQKAVEAEILPALKALESLPKTPTGKTTKAVRLAEQALLMKRSDSFVKEREAGNLVRHAMAAACADFNRTHGNAATLDAALECLGYLRDENLEGKLQDTSRSLAQEMKANEYCRQRGGAYADYRQAAFVTEKHRVYVDRCGLHHAVLCVESNGTPYRVTYFGGAPKLGALGLYFCHSTTTGVGMFNSDRTLENGTMNMSARGEEYDEACEARLQEMLAYLKFCRHLSVQAPQIPVNHGLAPYDNMVVEALANGCNVPVYRVVETDFCGDRYRVTKPFPSEESRTDATYVGFLSPDFVFDLSSVEKEELDA